jgi:Regulator of G protein signaling domain
LHPAVYTIRDDLRRSEGATPMTERTTVAERADDARARRVGLAGVPQGFDELWSSRTHWDDYIAFCVGNLFIAHVRFLLAVAEYQWNPTPAAFYEICDQYIDDEGPASLNLDPLTRRRIFAKLNPDSHVFDDVERQVRELLRREFSAFREWLADRSA